MEEVIVQCDTLRNSKYFIIVKTKMLDYLACV